MPLAAVRLRCGPGKVRGQFDALRLAPGKRGRRLAQAHIPQADLVKDCQLFQNPLLAGKEAQRLLDGQVEHLVDVLPFVLHLQHGGFVAGSIALLAGQLDVGEELHLHRDRAIALADVAAASRHIKGEVAGGVSPALGLGLGGKELPDGVEGLDVGDRIGSRGAPDRRLVDQNDIVQPLRSLELTVQVRRVAAFVLAQRVGHRRVEHVVHQG